MSADLVSNISFIISILSAVIAYSLYRLNTRQVSGDVIYRVIEQLEAPPLREIRRMVYALERDKFAEWDKETLQKLDLWGAELDIVATVLRLDSDTNAFFYLYGDVILRSIYQIAPYANHQRTIRGKQFLLPLEKFGRDLIRIWKLSVKSGEYPHVIGLPNRPTISLSYETFNTDRDCQGFLQRRV
jgi:hypothetical protein